MPVPKQTTELIFSLRALIYRIRQLKKERHGYSKAKHRELAKLLKDGRDDLARIKTEDVIGNDNVIAALEILELYCEQLHVRANIVDHIALEQKRTGPKRKQSGGETRRERHGSDVGSGSASGGGWGIWKILGFGSPQSPPPPTTTTTATTTTRHAALQQATTHGETPSENQAATPAVTTEVQSEEELRQMFPSPLPQEKDVYLDPDLDRAAAVIFYCYVRLPRDIPGLPELRAKLIQRWGSDFASKAQEADPSIPLPEELIERLRVQNPPESLVENYLKEIAKAHGIPWHQDEDEEGQDEEEAVKEVGVGGGGKEDGSLASRPNETDGSQTKGNDDKPGSLAGNREDTGPQHPQENHHEKLSSGGFAPLSRGSQDSATNNQPSSKAKAPAPAASTVENKRGGIPDIDELSRRFEALKR
ncbi:hypothetical protein PABG_02430 [Paracoccidioides brasiliensis Pb03]|nr:hypothetical protein PABG_02430 [Paracoccidioides brasiliensis Pb03]